uniref:NlpC/P60 domain-containing protein n=1 Tax=mine drainage metagenome TaxID=410659 RepID=E6Q2Q1_9ZZZZ
MKQAFFAGIVAAIAFALPLAASAAPTSSTASPDVTAWTSHLLAVQAQVKPKHEGLLERFAGSVLSRTSKIAQGLTHSALRFLGVPYVFGGTTAAGFDCSGYVQHVFAMVGIHLPRTADAQYYAGKPVRGHLVAGDLVFFQTYAPGPSHVGIYLGHGKFVSASDHGVMVSSLSEPYWASRYLGAKTYIASK